MEPDEAAIRANITRCQDGWNAGDGEAFGAPFAEDADYIIVNGMHVSGRAAIAARHQQIFDTVYRGSHNTFTVEDIRFVRPDVAIARARARLHIASARPRARVTPGTPGS